MADRERDWRAEQSKLDYWGINGKTFYPSQRGLWLKTERVWKGKPKARGALMSSGNIRVITEMEKSLTIIRVGEGRASRSRKSVGAKQQKVPLFLSTGKRGIRLRNRRTGTRRAISRI